MSEEPEEPEEPWGPGEPEEPGEPWGPGEPEEPGEPEKPKEAFISPLNRPELVPRSRKMSISRPRSFPFARRAYGSVLAYTFHTGLKPFEIDPEQILDVHSDSEAEIATMDKSLGEDSLLASVHVQSSSRTISIPPKSNIQSAGIQSKFSSLTGPKSRLRPKTYARPTITSAPYLSYILHRHLHQCEGAGDGAGSKVGKSRFMDFDLTGGIYIVTGAAQGLGLTLAEGVAEAGGTVYCLDRQRDSGSDFSNSQKMIPCDSQGMMIYGQVDVLDTDALRKAIQTIASRHRRLNGCIAAASVNEVITAIDYTVEQSDRTMKINFDGVMRTARACAEQMLKHKTPNGSIILITTMSGVIANRDLYFPVYNASKAAVIQLGRSLAMEWSPTKEDGSGGIRVNCISPGNIHTPRVAQHFVDQPHLKAQWENGNMLGRVSRPQEFRGAAIFLLSKASSFMTGHNMIIDGGYTSW